MENLINKPRISKWIGRSYILLIIVVAGLFSTIAVWSGILGMFLPGIIFTAVTVFAVVLIGVITFFFYRTAYTIRDGRLYSWSPFATIELDTKDIIIIEQTRVPYSLKGYGAGFYSGMYFIPGFGWTKVIITNLTDGVLISDTNGKRYLITPSDPKGFVETIKSEHIDGAKTIG
jgi:hypothetical protein